MDYVFCYKCGCDVTDEKQYEKKGRTYCQTCGYKPTRRKQRLKDGLDNGYAYIEINGMRKRRYRIIAELMMNRALEPYENVHHINFNKLDDRPENLYVCTWHEHRVLHNTRKQVVSNLTHI